MAGRYRGTNPPVRMGDERRGLLGSRLYGRWCACGGGSYDTPTRFHRLHLTRVLLNIWGHNIPWAIIRKQIFNLPKPWNKGGIIDE
jgi:hypothetical protein